MLHHVVSSREHRIGPLEDYAVTPSQLDFFLRTRKEQNVIDGGQDLISVPGDQSLIITFDDGYRNNLAEALPVLEKHEVPCFLFITTGFVDGTVYPYELELAEVIERAGVLSIPDRSEPVTLQNASERRSLYREIRLPLKPTSRAEREAYMDRLAYLNEYDRTDMQREPLLDWDDVCELSDHPLVTIGAHTHSHVLLSRQSWRTAWVEIRRSKLKLESQTHSPVHHFSYPYGGNSVVVRQMLRWAGFQYGFTTQARRVEQVTSWNRYSLPRIDISEPLPNNA